MLGRLGVESRLQADAVAEAAAAPCAERISILGIVHSLFLTLGRPPSLSRRESQTRLRLYAMAPQRVNVGLLLR